MALHNLDQPDVYTVLFKLRLNYCKSKKDHIIVLKLRNMHLSKDETTNDDGDVDPG